MNAARTLDNLSTQAIDLITEAHRSGIEVGLRRVCKTGRCIGPDDIFREIVRLDDEFNQPCPCVHFRDDLCERCGKPDTLGLRKIGE